MSEIADFWKAWGLNETEMPEPVAGVLYDLEQLQNAALGLVLPAAAGGGSLFDIIGQYSAFIVVSWLDAVAAQACLPPHLELAPPPGTPAGKHPVMYSFGRHRNVHPRFFHLWSYDYEEALMGLPCLQLRHADGSTSGPVYNMTAVRLDNEFADLIGVALGFPKRLANIQMGNTTYSIQMPGGPGPVMSGQFNASGGVFPPTFPNFQQIAQMVLQQPVISVAPGGAYLRTPFYIDTAAALMFPATAQFRVTDNSMCAFPAGEYQFPGIDVTAFGSCYHSVHNWTMSPPSIVVL
jgi:Acetoacetate decarboxylase (ADC)